jgi:putative proteasome-type protease
MTYCLGIITSSGLIIAADSRTNAGVDYISTYEKLFDFSMPGDRVIIICTSGNLSITQAVISSLKKDIKTQQETSLHSLSTMYDIARYIGNKLRTIQDQDKQWLKQDGVDWQSSLLLGGQIKGEEPELYLIYSQGNFIHATSTTPFFQIGETKYGKPILDRILSYETPIKEAAKCALLSIDSTMKSNISVGPPIHLIMYEANSLVIKHRLELGKGNTYLAEIREHWEVAIKKAFDDIPAISWLPEDKI